MDTKLDPIDLDGLKAAGIDVETELYNILRKEILIELMKERNIPTEDADFFLECHGWHK